MDIISLNEAATANGRIESFIENPDSTSGIVTVPKVIASGENITIPAGRVAVLPNVQVDGTLNIEGDVFIPSGATFSKVVETEGNQTIAGVKTFNSSPIVPTPTTGTQAVNKDYADLKVALESFIGTNQSLADNGYQKLPGGLIIQWGRSPSQISAGANTTVSLPIAFPNTFLRGYAFYDSDSSPQVTFNVGKLSLSQIKIYNTHSTNAVTPSYIAIGY